MTYKNKRYCLLDDVLLFSKKEGVPISKLLFSASHKHTGDCNQNPKQEPLYFCNIAVKEFYFSWEMLQFIFLSFFTIVLNSSP